MRGLLRNTDVVLLYVNDDVCRLASASKGASDEYLMGCVEGN